MWFMKIICGIYKGRNLEGHNLDGTRPTMERIKESLFAIIQSNIKDSIVLDLFSGSGNLGIEALSQGAKFSYLVDANYKATSVIKNNIAKIGISSCEILTMDYKKALEYLFNKNIKLDLIFLDPPYSTNYIEQSIKLIEQYDLLNDKGLIICENDNLDKIVYSSNFKMIKDKKYGDKWVVVLQKMC